LIYFPQAGASVDAQLTLNPAPAYYEAIAVTHGYARIHASKTYFAVEVRMPTEAHYVEPDDIGSRRAVPCPFPKQAGCDTRLPSRDCTCLSTRDNRA